VPTWHCGQRTEIERAIREGRLTDREGLRLLQAYGLPSSAESKVFTGQPAKKPERLW